MRDTDLELRRVTYAFFVAHGRAPVATELGEPEEVVAGFAYRVQAGGRWW